jgi:asparagine synthase (glutamine-hydrolysing)
MCGICGIFRFDAAPVDTAALHRMVRALAHRGPDDSGVEQWPGIGLGHTRLSIIDLSAAGHQPMSNEDGSLWIAYNGELYNVPEIREALRGSHTFKSHTDTELVLHAFEEWGPDCVDRFNGIFAFAIVDVRNRRLFAARDQLGVKPFYYTVHDGSLMFASEVKALFAGGVPPRLAREQMAEFLMYGWNVGERTLFADVLSLAPGHRLFFDPQRSRQITTECYYSPLRKVSASLHAELARCSDAELIDRCDQLLQESVGRQMVSDVPVGTMCSGGVDSSLITALAVQRSRDTSIYNVSIADSPELSEERYAKQVAQHLGVSINYHRLDRDNFLGNLIDTIYHADFPIYNLNAVAVFQICRMAREQGVKVLLAGEGGDELFGGYAWRHERLYRNVRFRRRFGRTLNALLSRTADLATIADDGLFLPHFRTTSGDVAAALHFASGFYSRSLRWQEALAAYSFLELPEEQYAQAAMLCDVREYLEHLLNREDKHSMQTSVECRVPILDPKVVEFAVNLPFDRKIRRHEGKWVVKQVAERYIPRSVIYREKRGFNLPGRKYLDVNDAFFRGGFWEREFGFNPAAVKSLLPKGEGGFWYAFPVTEIWARLMLDGESRESVADRIKATRS